MGLSIMTPQGEINVPASSGGGKSGTDKQDRKIRKRN